jgi:hypothetical protein
MSAVGTKRNSAASGELHVRNEHANVQYRINGIILPDGVSGFGPVLESDFIPNIALITGGLPAEYGYRTSALVDIRTKSGSQDAGGKITLYGGSQQTITPNVEYGGVVGQTEYFALGRYFTSDEGIENSRASSEHRGEEPEWMLAGKYCDPACPFCQPTIPRRWRRTRLGGAGACDHVLLAGFPRARCGRRRQQARPSCSAECLLFRGQAGLGGGARLPP